MFRGVEGVNPALEVTSASIETGTLRIIGSAVTFGLIYGLFSSFSLAVQAVNRGQPGTCTYGESPRPAGEAVQPGGVERRQAGPRWREPEESGCVLAHVSRTDLLSRLRPSSAASRPAPAWP